MSSGNAAQLFYSRPGGYDGRKDCIMRTTNKYVNNNDGREIIDRHSYYAQAIFLLCELVDITEALLADDRDTFEMYGYMTDIEKNSLTAAREHIGEAIMELE